MSHYSDVQQHYLSPDDITRFNKIAIQGTPQMAVEKDAIAYRQSTHYSNSKCTLPLH